MSLYGTGYDSDTRLKKGYSVCGKFVAAQNCREEEVRRMLRIPQPRESVKGCRGD